MRASYDIGAARTTGLKTREQNAVARVGCQRLEMVQNAPTGRHATGGNDDRRFTQLIQTPGFIYRADDMRAPAHCGAFLRCQPMLAPELLVQDGCVGGHRAVEVDRDIRYQAIALELVQVVHQQLGTANGERRHQGDAMTQKGLVDDWAGNCSVDSVGCWRSP